MGEKPNKIDFEGLSSFGKQNNQTDGIKLESINQFFHNFTQGKQLKAQDIRKLSEYFLRNKKGVFEKLDDIDHSIHNVFFESKGVILSQDDKYLYMSSGYWGNIKDSYFVLEGNIKGKMGIIMHGRIEKSKLQNLHHNYRSVADVLKGNTVLENIENKKTLTSIKKDKEPQRRESSNIPKEVFKHENNNIVLQENRYLLGKEVIEEELDTLRDNFLEQIEEELDEIPKQYQHQPKYQRPYLLKQRVESVIHTLESYLNDPGFYIQNKLKANEKENILSSMGTELQSRFISLFNERLYKDGESYVSGYRNNEKRNVFGGFKDTFIEAVNFDLPENKVLKIYITSTNGKDSLRKSRCRDLLQLYKYLPAFQQYIISKGLSLDEYVK